MSIWSFAGEWLRAAIEIWRDTPSAIKAIMTTAVGAIFGAWLASRSQAKRRVVDELKAVRSAHALCFTVTNKALAIKRQNIRPLKQRYDQALAAYLAHQANPQGPLNLGLDLQNLSQVKFASDTLLRLVIDRCALGPKGVAAAVQVVDSTDDLKLSIDYRNQLIQEFQKNPPPTHLQKIQTYLGLQGAGIIDERIKVNVQALSHQVDDCIFFSKVLAEELASYGNALRKRYRFWYRLGLPKLVDADWSRAQAENLMPTEDQFAGWLRGFERPPSKWKRFSVWITGA